MQEQHQLPMFTLLLMISFASVNAVLFTPGLPNPTHFFTISNDIAQQTITWYLVGYAAGQLIYGPLANRFGRKPSLMGGIMLQIFSSLLCVLAGWTHAFTLLVFGRFLLALGAGVGLKMTFTLVNECYEPKVASQKIALLTLAFAITPGLGVALGGVLNEYFGWTSCFYAGACYGVILLLLVRHLPETQKNLNYNALKLGHLLHDYGHQFKNIKLVSSGFLMGGVSSFVYVFATLAPFIAINQFGLSSSEYGFANILPPIGLLMGSLLSVRLAKTLPFESIILYGICISGFGILVMFLTTLTHQPVLISLMFPMIIIYLGSSLVLPSASSLAMSYVSDKAHGSAVMSFLNMGLATGVVLMLGFFPVSSLLLPLTYLFLIAGMVVLYILVRV